MGIASQRQMRFKFGALLALSIGASSCGSGDGTGIGAGGPPGGLEANFDSIQVLVFDQYCVACHIGGSAPAGLRLDQANSYNLLVGIPSVQQPGLQRVEPGNPNSSYLIQKLEGTASSGEQMPLSAPPLSDSDVAVIRQWITDGALRDSDGQPPTEPIRVSSMSPLPDSTELRVPMTVMVMFDREVDANTVNATTFLLDRSGGDGTFDDGNEVAIAADSVTVSNTNPRAATFDLTGSPAVEDTYRVTLVGTGPAVIADLDANALDGEYVGTFPSGDATAGGNFVATFEVAGVQPSLASIQENVFTVSCAGCHTGGGASLPASLDLTSEAASFAAMVGVPSVEDPVFDLVEPNDADNSYLIQKLEGTASAGAQMPLFLMPLDDATIQAIREWVDNGANP